MQKKLIKKFYQLNKALYNKAKNPLRSHGPDHHERVCSYSLLLASKLAKRGIKADREILIAASFLHDLAAFYPDKIKNPHKNDHLLAKAELKKMNFPKEKIEKAVEVIKNHGSDPKYKKNNEPIETAILRDADKIEAFGPLGVARIIMARTINGDDLNKIVQDFYSNGHLERKWKSITTKEAREICRDNYKYSLNFFASLFNSFKK